MKPVNTSPVHDRSSGSVYVIDDDAAVRDQLHRLLHGTAHDVHMFASLREFSRYRRCDDAACLVMAFHLSSLYRLEHPGLRAHLFGDCPPIVFTAAQADVYSGVRAIKLGAIDFLMKPLDGAEVLAAVSQGISEDRTLRAAEARKTDVRKRYAALTPRERQVLGLVARGRLSKQIAGDLGLSVNTIKMYRSNAMRRMAVPTRAELIGVLEGLEQGTNSYTAPQHRRRHERAHPGRDLEGRGLKAQSLLTGYAQD